MRAVYTYSQGAAYKHNALWLCKRRKTWATAKPPLCRGICTIYVQEQQSQRRRSDVSFPKSRNWQHKLTELTEVCASVCEGHPNSRGWKVMCVRVCVCEINAVCCFHFIMFYISGRRRRCNATVDASRAKYRRDTRRIRFILLLPPLLLPPSLPLPLPLCVRHQSTKSFPLRCQRRRCRSTPLLTPHDILSGTRHRTQAAVLP